MGVCHRINLKKKEHEDKQILTRTVIKESRKQMRSAKEYEQRRTFGDQTRVCAFVVRIKQ